MKTEPILCYVDAPWAYFTTLPLDAQWGDDWGDAPYEHNAGEPYHGSAWQIVKVAYAAELDTPQSGCLNSQYSVEKINRGTVPWLRTPDWGGGETAQIYAGTTLSDFCAAIEAAGGKVYVERGSE